MEADYKQSPEKLALDITSTTVVPSKARRNQGRKADTCTLTAAAGEQPLDVASD
jgi:hypothetical protein